MAERRVVWTEKAQAERKAILKFWIEHNQSNTYSIKLNNLIVQTLKTIKFLPFIGRETNKENIRVTVIKKYLLFYEVTDEEIIVLSLWDNRRNPKDRRIKG